MSAIAQSKQEETRFPRSLSPVDSGTTGINVEILPCKRRTLMEEANMAEGMS